MDVKPLTFGAGDNRIIGQGTFFMLTATTDPVDVEFFFQGTRIAIANDVEAGYKANFRDRNDYPVFTDVKITSATAQTIYYGVAQNRGEGAYDRAFGTVSVDGEIQGITDTVNVNVAGQSSIFFPDLFKVFAAQELNSTAYKDISVSDLSANRGFYISNYLVNMGPILIGDSIYTSSGDYHGIELQAGESIKITAQNRLYLQNNLPIEVLVGIAALQVT